MAWVSFFLVLNCDDTGVAGFSVGVLYLRTNEADTAVKLEARLADRCIVGYDVSIPFEGKIGKEGHNSGGRIAFHHDLVSVSLAGEEGTLRCDEALLTYRLHNAFGMIGCFSSCILTLFARSAF